MYTEYSDYILANKLPTKKNKILEQLGSLFSSIDSLVISKMLIRVRIELNCSIAFIGSDPSHYILTKRYDGGGDFWKANLWITTKPATKSKHGLYQN